MPQAAARVLAVYSVQLQPPRRRQATEEGDSGAKNSDYYLLEQGAMVTRN